MAAVRGGDSGPTLRPGVKPEYASCEVCFWGQPAAACARIRFHDGMRDAVGRVVTPPGLGFCEERCWSRLPLLGRRIFVLWPVRFFRRLFCVITSENLSCEGQVWMLKEGDFFPDPQAPKRYITVRNHLACLTDVGFAPPYFHCRV